MSFIQSLLEVVRFFNLPKEQRRITFYSEGKNYWPHLTGLIKELLKTSDIPICYISSDKKDPGLSLKHQYLNTFKIDDGYIRNWLFENIETDVMVMTMPDLHQYQVKRSKHKVHYVYVQHSLVSLHMIYRKGAFDHFDTVFCAGPHQIKEIRAMEEKYNLPSKNLVKHGYGHLDSIIENDKKRKNKNISNNAGQHILVAPSWGPEGLIESGVGGKLIEQLLKDKFKVTLRPHPQTIKIAKRKIDDILKKYSKNKLFNYEDNIAGQDSLHSSDIMISDWSGAALDFAFGLHKPVVFINTPLKVNNLDYQDIGIEPFEISIRKHLGHIVEINNINNIAQYLNPSIFDYTDKLFFNLGKSAKKGSLIIEQLCNEV